MTKNWGQAVPVAVEALGTNDICDEVPLDVASAAQSLLHDPIWLGRDDDDGYFYVNGGHPEWFESFLADRGTASCRRTQ